MIVQSYIVVELEAGVVWCRSKLVSHVYVGDCPLRVSQYTGKQPLSDTFKLEFWMEFWSMQAQPTDRYQSRVWDN